MSANWSKLPYYRAASFQHIDSAKWDRLVGGDLGLESEDNHLVSLWDECPQAVSQEGFIQDQDWYKAKQIYLDHGIVSETFMNFVVELRLLWQKTKFNFLFNLGDSPWQGLAQKLDQYMEWRNGWDEITDQSNYLEKLKMMECLFGNQLIPVE